MKLLYLSATLFVGFAALSVFLKQDLKPVPVVQTKAEGSEPPVATPRPSLSPRTLPSISGTSLYIETGEGAPLFSRNSDLRVPPASTTKMMTALVAIETYNLKNIITIPRFEVTGQQMHIFTGEKISVESLLYGLLVFSANDAAEALARIYPGGRQAFIGQMNAVSKRIGMTGTIFKNPTGLDESGHLSTAKDMATLGLYLMQNPKLREIVGTTRVSVRSADERFIHDLSSTNELLSTVPGVLGIKTGWTEESRENLITYVDRKGSTTVIALFGSDDRFGDTRKLIDWIYEEKR